MPACGLALHTASNSHGSPTKSLNPAGLPPDSRRISPINSIISIGVENREWRDGDTQSWPLGTPRVRAISAETFAAGNTPPLLGVPPHLIFRSTLLSCSPAAISANSFPQQ